MIRMGVDTNPTINGLGVEESTMEEGDTAGGAGRALKIRPVAGEDEVGGVAVFDSI